MSGVEKLDVHLQSGFEEEDTDITLIDINPDRINEITDEVDAMGVVGNGARYEDSYGSGN